jgi:hypothetical protein
MKCRLSAWLQGKVGKVIPNKDKSNKCKPEKLYQRLLYRPSFLGGKWQIRYSWILRIFDQVPKWRIKLIFERRKNVKVSILPKCIIISVPSKFIKQYGHKVQNNVHSENGFHFDSTFRLTSSHHQDVAVIMMTCKLVETLNQNENRFGVSIVLYFIKYGHDT